MEKIDRELLIKDICSRLPYGVYVKFQQYDNPLFLHMKDALVVYNGGELIDTIQYLYLRPMSSMTDEERNKLKAVTCPNGTGYFNEQYLVCPMNHFGEQISFDFMSDIIDWLNEHHFDFRGLIEKGLALDAPDGMYKTE